MKNFLNIFIFVLSTQFIYSQLQGSATHIASATTDLIVNEWTYIAITKGANNEGKFYKNGILIYSGPWANLSYSWNRLDLGAVFYTNFSNWFNGQIDEVRISNIVRTQSAISNHFNNNVPFIADSNTLGLWHFDQINPNVITSTVGQNGVGHNTTSALGKFGNSISYNGINSRVQINQTIPVQNITLEFWIKPNVNQTSWPISFYGMNTSGFSTFVNSCIPPAPTGNASQTLCSSSTVASLTAVGTNIQWYAASTGGTALASTSALVNGTTYYASQTISGCESTTRLAVIVNLNNPTVSASATTVCSGQQTTLTASTGTSSTNACSNFSNSLIQGLKAWYPFCGNANDLSGNNLNGNVSGAQLSTDRFGNLNSAYSFSNNQQITIPGTESQNHYPLTISLWYNPANQPVGAQTNIFSKYVPASWNGFQILYGDNTNVTNNGTNLNNGFGTQSWYARNISNRVIGYFGSPGFLQSNVNINTWYHYVFVLDSTGGKIYVNGQLVSTDTWDGTPGTSTNNFLWKIGGQYSNTWFNGKIDDLGVWNRTLSLSEIQELYTQSSSTYSWSTGATTESINVNPTTTTQYWVDVTTNGVTCRKFITITVNSTTPAPTGNASQTLCSSSTVASLTAVGTNIQWYAASTGGTALASTSALVNGTTYYASQTISGCESTTRLAVIVNLNNPTVSASATTVCSGQQTTLTASTGSSTTSNFSIGSIGPAGGYVFYDQGSVINGWRYLEVASNDYGNPLEWGCDGTNIPGTSIAIGTGQTNTNLIIQNCNSNNIAAKACHDAVINGFSDWYLPSREDFNLIYQNLNPLGVGNFINSNGNQWNRYWTSSQVGAFAYAQDFTPYFQQITQKVNQNKVRPIRQFASGTTSSTYSWSTGATTESINVNPTTTTQYWVDVTTNGVTCRKFITITVNSTPTLAENVNYVICEPNTDGFFTFDLQSHNS